MEAEVGFLDLGSTFWPGDLFEVKIGPGKHIFAEEWFCGEDLRESILPE